MMMRHVLALLALVGGLAAPAVAVEIKSDVRPGYVPKFDLPGEIAINRGDGRLFYADETSALRGGLLTELDLGGYLKLRNGPTLGHFQDGKLKLLADSLGIAGETGIALGPDSGTKWTIKRADDGVLRIVDDGGTPRAYFYASGDVSFPGRVASGSVLVAGVEMLRISRTVVFPPLAAFPTSPAPVEGETAYLASDKKLYTYKGSGWEAIGGATGASTPPKIEIFDSSGTWTKDANAKTFKVFVQGAGGGGASGIRASCTILLDAIDAGTLIDNRKHSAETIRILKAYDAATMPVVKPAP